MREWWTEKDLLYIISVATFQFTKINKDYERLS